MMRIEIDRTKGIIEKTQGFSFWKKQREWDLNRFDRVRLAAEATSVEEGYGTIRYSVFLEARDVSLEMLSTDNEQQARALYDELADFLAAGKSLKR